jgi:hypothetical protein
MSSQAHQLIGFGRNREKDDFYSTPPHATEQLLSVEKFEGNIFEPCCGQGHISKVLIDHGYTVESSDLIDRGYGETGIDFLFERNQRDNIITNPPFKLATKMVSHSQYIAKYKIAMLLKITFLEGIERYDLFKEFPPIRIWVFSKRVTTQKGADEKIKGGMFCFAWFVWQVGNKKPPTVGWLL